MPRTVVPAASRFGGAPSPEVRERIFAEAIEQAAELVEQLLADGMPPEDFPGHIRALSPFAERD
jgi:hypothetical protein